MSESPKRNCPNNTVAIVARPGLRPAPTSTGTVRQTILSYNAHTQTTSPPPANPPLSWHPSFHPDHPMNKNENLKMDVEKKSEGGKGWEPRGEKQSVLAGISRGFLPMRFPHTDLGRSPSSVSPHGRISSMPRRDHTATKWFHDLIWDSGGKDASRVLSFHSGGASKLCSGCVGERKGWRWAVCWGKCSLLDRQGLSGGV